MTEKLPTAYYTLDLSKVSRRTLSELEAHSAELWLRYRAAERKLLSDIFHSILSGVIIHRQDAISHLIVNIQPHPSDPRDAIDDDLGTALAWMMALADDPATDPGTAEVWRGLIVSVEQMRSQLREQMGQT